MENNQEQTINHYPDNPDYSLSPEERVSVVKTYYMGVTSDAVKRIELYSMDSLARKYLIGEDYRLLYGVLLGFWNEKDMSHEARKITTKELLKGIFTVVTYCKQQPGCQNCILRDFGCDHWNCQMYAFELSEVLANIKAKKKNHGFI